MEKKTLYVNEWQGKDENDGLASDRAVLTSKRAMEVQRKERTQATQLIGSRASKNVS